MYRSILTFGMLCFFSTVSVAQTWDTTFHKDAVGAKISGTGVKVMVAASGDPIDEAKSAATALANALRQNSQVELVMTDDALGDLSSSDDTTIVQKCAPFKLHYVYVVRVFSKADEGQFSVVATLYDSAGEAVDGLSGEKGVALSAHTEKPGAGQGISNETTEAVSKITKVSEVNQKEAEAEYLKRYVWFEDWVAINANTGAVAGRWTVPFKGKYKEPLKGKQFYMYINQPELAEKYRKKSALKWGLYAGGGVVMLTGLGLMLGSILGLGDIYEANYEDCEDLDIMSPEYDTCREEADAEVERKEKEREDKSNALMISGGAVAGVGAVTVMAALFIKRHPVNATEGRQLVEKFNNDLKKELGLPEDFGVSESAQLKRPEKPKLDFSPVLSAREQGLMLRVSF